MFIVFSHLSCQDDSKRWDLDLQEKDSFCSTNQRKGCCVCRSSHCGVVCPETLVELFVPVTFGTRDELLEQFSDGLNEGLSRTISWWIICRRGYALYPKFSAELLEGMTDELPSIVVHDSPRNVEAIENMVLDELDNV